LDEREKGGKSWLPYQPLNPGTLEDLNPRQRKYLDAFIERYAGRTRESKRMTQSYRSAHADLRASASFRLCTKEMRYPIIGVRSAGSKLWDADGNEYVDYTMGYGVNLFGHGAPFITDALKEQMCKGIQIGPQSELAGEVAALISEMTGMDRVTFANTGTEAVMAALRLARLATGRNKVVIFAGSYHGTYDGVLVVGQVKNGVYGASPMTPGIPPGVAEEVIVLNYGSQRSLEFIQSHAHELAAVLVEPVQSRRPDLQPREFLRELRRITEEAGAILIFDEVITGFRIHPGGAQAWFGVRADLACYGKIIGGGMPIGAIAGRADVMSGIDGGMWRFGDSSLPGASTTLYTGTFCKHPLAMAAARAVLNHIKDQGPEMYTQLNQRATRLVEALNAYCEEGGVPIQVVQFGSLFRLGGPLLLQAPDALDLLFYHLIEKGIYVWEGRNWFLSTVHTDADLEAVSGAFKQSAAEMREGGFLPETGSRPSAGSASASAHSGGAGGAEAGRPDSLTLAMTETQKRLWFLSQASDGDSGAYHQSIALQLRGPLRLQAMRNAFQQVADRHEALRTTFDQGESQHIRSRIEIDVPLVDFSEWKQPEQEARIERWLQVEGTRPFDLRKGPLLRACLLKLEAEHHLLVITAHHLVTDGWSMGVILKEAGSFYSAECEGKAARLPRPAQFREFVEWQNAESRKAGMDEAEAYWLKQLAGSETVPALPADRPRRPGHSSAGARRHTTLDRSLSAGLTALSVREGCTLFMTLLAAYQVLIHQLTSQEDSVIVMPAAGQSLADSAHLIGDCSNLLPLRTKIGPQASFSSHLVSVKDDLLNGYRSLDCPFANLVSKLNPPQDPSRWPFFNIDKPLATPKFFELELDFVQFPISQTNFDLSLNFTQLGSELQVAFDYKTDLFDDETVRGWMNHFTELLGILVKNPAIPLSDLPLPALPGRPAATELGEDGDSNAAWAPPRTPAEKILAELWAKALGVEKIGVHDNFFALGGHSLLATQLISRIRDLFHVDLMLRPLFDHPTIAGLAGYLDRMGGATRGAAPPITPASRGGAAPLSFAQERLWFIERMEPGNIAYNMPGALLIKGRLNIEALQAALSEIVRRHEVLRTVFADLSGQPVQVIEPTARVDLPLTDLRDAPEAKRRAAALQQAEEEVRRPFNLARGPMLRTSLLRLGEEEHVLVVAVHHIVADGWSMGVLVGELTALYRAYSLGEPSPLPEPVIQYRDYSIWQREWLQGEVLESQLDYWKRQLAGAPLKTELPVDRFQQARSGFRGAHEPFALPGALTEALKELSRQEDATLFMTLLAAFQTLLYRYSGQKDIIVGADIANRNHSETEPLIGFFVNLLALRTDLSGDPAFRELLRRVRGITLDAYAHQDVPFGKIVEVLRPERGVTRTPFVQALCVLQNAPMPPLKLADLEVSLLPVDGGTAEFELILDIEETGEGLSCSLRYNTDLFDQDTIVKMAERYRRLLESVAGRPDQPLSAIPLLSEAESGGLAVFDFPDAELTQKDFESLVSKLSRLDRP
jgi:iturin family lipopeptide synthetase A